MFLGSRGYLFVLLIQVFAFYPAMVIAQSNKTKISEFEKIKLPKTDEPSVAERIFRGEFKFEYSEYSTQLAENPDLNNSALSLANFNVDSKSETSERKINFLAGQNLSWNNSFYALQELYYNRHLVKSDAQLKPGVVSKGAAFSADLAIGRKKQDWSQVDEDWQLGLWEPKFNLDPLRPYGQGLSGLFLNVANYGWNFLAFGSTIFVPTMGPEIREKNGNLVSNSRWFRAPSPTATVIGQDTKLVYSIQNPDVAKLVRNPGSGMRISWNKSEQGPWISANMAYKPINNLLLKYDANLIASSTASEGQVVVTPAVVYHRLYGTDLGWNFKNSRLSASWLRDIPDDTLPKNEENTDWVQQQPGQIEIYSINWQNWLGDNPSSSPEIALGYLSANETETRDRAFDGVDRGSLFQWRLNYSNAAQIKFSMPFSYAKDRKGKLSISSIRELDQRGSIYSAEYIFAPTKNWALTMGADVIGVDDSSAKNQDPRFFNEFRANDRLYSGVSYVF
jgi:hypothetical protein